MIKRNKVKLIISSAIILLPMLLAFPSDKLLPEKIAVHWGADGSANGFMNAKLAFIIMPLILLAVHWICILLEAYINKNAEQNKKIGEIIFWIIPAISLVVCGSVFSAALGHTNNMLILISVLLAVTFIVLGNYMPKATRNLTTGIKIKWALSNDENWNATHRFGGKVFVASGFLMLLSIPLPSAFIFVMIAVILLAVVSPIVYSYAFYKRQLREGKVTKEDYEKGYSELVKNKKLPIIISVIILAALTIFFPIIMFTGNIEITLNDTSFELNASFSDELSVDYAKIDAIEYRENGVDGTRVMGFGSARLLLGTFENAEFGSYTRYTYTGKNPCIVLRSGEDIMVVGLKDAEETRALYDELSAKLVK